MHHHSEKGWEIRRADAPYELGQRLIEEPLGERRQRRYRLLQRLTRLHGHVRRARGTEHRNDVSSRADLGSQRNLHVRNQSQHADRLILHAGEEIDFHTGKREADERIDDRAPCIESIGAERDRRRRLRANPYGDGPISAREISERRKARVERRAPECRKRACSALRPRGLTKLSPSTVQSGNGRSSTAT